jgi:hypothetical protein
MGEMTRYVVKAGGLVAVAAIGLACSRGSSSGESGSGGAGGAGSSGSTFSCNGANGSAVSCYEYKNVSAQELATLNSSCRGTKGTGCPTANLTGCCKLPQQGATSFTMEVCYYGTPSGQNGCSLQGGTWSTTP